MMLQFLIPHLKNLKNNEYIIDIACSNVGNRFDEVVNQTYGIVDNVYSVHLNRTPYRVNNLKGVSDLKRIISRNQYDFIWTNEPVMGIATRIAAKSARKKNTKVVYMVHGFHFYEGCPLQNWLLYYPVERFASCITDVIVTINHEDYERALKMHAKRVEYIHGIGVDTTRLQSAKNLTDIRKELHLDNYAFTILSVGELMTRKNHQILIKALGMIQDRNIHLIICGKGVELSNLQKLAISEGIADNIHFLGYRNDVMDLYQQVDLFAFPSKREGLGLAALEAMYFGVPVVSSNTSGPRDYMQNGITGFMCDPDDKEMFAKAICSFRDNFELRKKCGEHNKEAVIPFCFENVKQEVLQIFNDL